MCSDISRCLGFAQSFNILDQTSRQKPIKLMHHEPVRPCFMKQIHWIIQDNLEWTQAGRGFAGCVVVKLWEIWFPLLQNDDQWQQPGRNVAREAVAQASILTPVTYTWTPEFWSGLKQQAKVVASEFLACRCFSEAFMFGAESKKVHKDGGVVGSTKRLTYLGQS